MSPADESIDTVSSADHLTDLELDERDSTNTSSLIPLRRDNPAYNAEEMGIKLAKKLDY